MKLYLSIFAGLLGIFAFTLPNLSVQESAYEQERVLATMRKIGHELLLSAGDKNSRVLPVEKAGNNSYLIRFDTDFRFATPALVEIVHQNFEKANLPAPYIVNVMACDDESVYYSYEFLPDSHVDSLSCLSRKNDYGCYVIKISFGNGAYLNPFNHPLVLISIPLILLSIAGFVYWKRQPAKGDDLYLSENDIISIGKIKFNRQARTLIFESKQEELTEKEAKILEIFALHPNEVIERDRLMKQVWEDEGVFVGRSLDVFVSRLRKKLSMDPSVSIANVHGLGYRLETNPI